MFEPSGRRIKTSIQGDDRPSNTSRGMTYRKVRAAAQADPAFADRLFVLSPATAARVAPEMPIQHGPVEPALWPSGAKLARWRGVLAVFQSGSGRVRWQVNTARTSLIHARRRRRTLCEGRLVRAAVRPDQCRSRRRMSRRRHWWTVLGRASGPCWPARAPTTPAWRTPAASWAAGGSRGRHGDGAWCPYGSAPCYFKTVRCSGRFGWSDLIRVCPPLAARYPTDRVSPAPAHRCRSGCLRSRRACPCAGKPSTHRRGCQSARRQTRP